MSDAPVGRPTLYEGKKTCRIAEHLCLLGAKEDQLAKAFNVSPDTIREWKVKHEKFSAIVREAKFKYDNEKVIDACLKSALGYEYVEKKITIGSDGSSEETTLERHQPPNPTSLQFWLSNRNRTLWKNKQEVEHTGPNGDPITFVLGEKVKPDATKV